MPEFSSWVDLATVVGGFATAFTAAFAIVGVPLVYLQIAANRKIQHEATSKLLYRQYLEDAISRPELVVPDLAGIQASGRYIQYELFVAHMLYSLEEILVSTKENGWRDVARTQLKRHLDYFKSPDFQPKRTFYDKELMDLLDALLSSDKAQSSDKT